MTTEIVSIKVYLQFSRDMRRSLFLNDKKTNVTGCVYGRLTIKPVRSDEFGCDSCVIYVHETTVALSIP